jgi:nucleotide-binding universal stress UspA family protein
LSRDEQAALKEIAEIAERRDQMARFRSRTSGERSEEIVQEAESAAATLIVMGVPLRPSEAMLFGETANRLLEESESSLLFVAS